MTNPKQLSADDARKVSEFHRNDDVDSQPESHHHSLGTQRSQSSPGNHTHDGITSIAILGGVTFTGSRTSNSADIINQICNALVDVGAVNNTSA